MLRMLKILPIILALSSFVLLTPGCGTDHATVRIVQASPDAGNVDIAVDGNTVVTDLAFGSISPASGYLTVAAGNRRVEVRDTGTTTDLINSTVDFATHGAYTLLASGKITDNTEALLLKTDDNSAPSSGNIKLRVIHDAPDAPNKGTLNTCDFPPCVDVYVVAPGTDITNVSATIPSLAYQQASDYQSLTAGTYEIIMTDSTDPAKPKLIDQTYTFTAGQIRTLVTLDVPAGDGMGPIPLELSDLN
jgi:uncharacterized protein DUF4397